MTQDIASQLRPFNNDRMAYFTAFRAPGHEARARQAAEGAAAPALESAPPRPTQLDERQAETALDAVQQQAQQGASAMAQVHSGLDAQRVARLLGLLD